MLRLAICLAFVSRAVAGDPTDGKTRAKIPAIALLPNGGQLKGVMLPRYNEKREQVGVLKAELMTLINAGQVDATQVTIEFFNPDQSPRARIDLLKATFYQEKGLVVTTDPVEIKSDRMTASGSALHYSITSGKGILSGPGTTTFKLPPPKP
jgi:hypothetical protein